MPLTQSHLHQLIRVYVVYFVNYRRLKKELPRLRAWYHQRADPQLQHGLREVDCNQWLLDQPFEEEIAHRITQNPSMLAHFINADSETKAAFKDYMRSLGRQHPIEINRYSVLTPYARSQLPDRNFKIHTWVHCAADGWLQDRMKEIEDQSLLSQ